MSLTKRIVDGDNEQLTQEILAARSQIEEYRSEIEILKAQLKDTTGKLVNASHKAAMAEVSTDMLHNVGNVLNSINVSATSIKDKMVNSEILNLKKLADILQEHSSDIAKYMTEDPQGRHIPTYIIETSKQLFNEQEEFVNQLKKLGKNINHVKEIVNMQQLYSRSCGVEVATTVDDVIEDSLQINKAGLKRHGINVIRDFEDFGTVYIDKQRVLQILVNLIGNAKYAISDAMKDEKIVTVRSSRHGKDRIRISIIDNGVGINRDNFDKIFGHGFTTKKHGHGFGLHSGSLAAKEMNGTLTAHSDGPGKGATFTLEIPYQLTGHRR